MTQADWSVPDSPRRVASGIILGLMILIFTVYFSWYTVRRYETLHAYTADLSLIDQAMWNTLHGRFLEATWGDHQQPRLAEHFEPILIPLAALFWLWDDVRILLVFQAFALAIGALPVYWLARSVLTETGGFRPAVALLFPLIYLLSPPLQAAAVADFHADPLVVAPFLFAFWYATQQRWRWLWFWAVVVMLTKENMPTLIIMLGGYLLLKSQSKAGSHQSASKSVVIRHPSSVVHGLGLIAAGGLWFAGATFGIVAPLAREYFGTTGPVYLSSRFSANPFNWPTLLADPARLRYLTGLLTTTGGLTLLAPHYLLLGLPLFVANTFSGFPGQYSGEQHYSAPLVAILTIAAIYGSRNLLYGLRLVVRKTPFTDKVPYLIGYSLLIGSVTVSLIYHTRYGWTPFSRRTETYTVTDHTRRLSDLLTQIPKDVPISASAAIHPHLAHRPVAYTFPTIQEAEFILVDVTDVPGKHPNDVKATIDNLISAGSWRLLAAVDGFILLQKSPGTEQQTLPDSFYDFARTQPAAPQIPLAIRFDDQLQLLGFDVVDRPFPQQTQVRLYWQALGPLPDNLTLWPQFYDDAGQPLSDPLLQPDIATRWYPPSHWQTNEIIVTETSPQNLGEIFHLGVGVVRGQNFADPQQRLPVSGADEAYDQATWAQVATFRRTDWSLTTLPPVPTRTSLQSLSASFENGLQLTGYRLSAANLLANEPLTITLSWQPTEPLPLDYTIFLHLIDAQGEIAAQNDAQPLWLAPYPTSRWQPHKLIMDSHIIQPPLPVGIYQLRLGLYDWQTLQRLPLETGADSVNLGEIQINLAD